MEKVFAEWPSIAALAADLGKSYSTVYSWQYRRHIPARFDLDLIRLANNRGGNLTLDDIAIARRDAAN